MQNRTADDVRKALRAGRDRGLSRDIVSTAFVSERAVKPAE